MVTGIAPLPGYQVDWITPPLINAYISTDSWRGVALQSFNFGVATLIYIPFVDVADRMKLSGRRKSFTHLVTLAESGTYGLAGKRLTDRPGSAGALARALINDMARSLGQNGGTIQLHYQSRVNMVQKTVPDVDALLCWEHPLFYGMVPAP